MATWKPKGNGGQKMEALLRVARPEMSGWRSNIPTIILKGCITYSMCPHYVVPFFGSHFSCVLRICRLYYLVIHHKYKNVYSIG